MKFLTLILILIAGILPAQAAIVPIPAFISAETLVEEENRYAEFKLRLSIYASGGDVYLTKKTMSMPFEFTTDGSGQLWKFTEESTDIKNSGIPYLEAVTFSRVTASPGGDTSTLFRVAAGQTSVFEHRMRMSISPVPTDEEIGEWWLGTRLSHLNWNSSSSSPAPFFLVLEGFETDTVFVAGVPEPASAMLMLAGSVLALSRRRRAA